MMIHEHSQYLVDQIFISFSMIIVKEQSISKKQKDI